VVCAFCGSAVAHERHVVRAADYRAIAEAMTREGAPSNETVVRLGNTGYRVLGHLGRGASSEVFLIERAHRLRERLVLKVLRAPADAEWLMHEADILRSLQSSTVDGAAHFTARLPEPTWQGELALPGGPRAALALRWAPGHTHELMRVMDEQLAELDPRHTIWVAKRVLEVLAWIHRCGVGHGAVLPEHLIVNARDHGVRLVGFSAARRLGQPLALLAEGREPFYPRSLLAGGAVTARTDLAQLGRSLIAALGGDPASGKLPERVPAELARLLQELAEPPEDDGPADAALSALDRLTQVARRVFGPPRFIRLELS
jgi:serine/threonine protein kinase